MQGNVVGQMGMPGMQGANMGMGMPGMGLPGMMPGVDQDGNRRDPFFPANAQNALANPGMAGTGPLELSNSAHNQSGGMGHSGASFGNNMNNTMTSLNSMGSQPGNPMGGPQQQTMHSMQGGMQGGMGMSNAGGGQMMEMME